MDPVQNQFEDSQRVMQFDAAQEALPDAKETCFSYETIIRPDLGGLNPMLGDKSGGVFEIAVKHFEIRNGMAEYLDKNFPEGIKDVSGSLEQLAHKYYDELQAGATGSRYTDAHRQSVIQSILACADIYTTVFSQLDMQLVHETIGSTEQRPIIAEPTKIAPLVTLEQVIDEFGQFLERHESVKKYNTETQYEMFLVSRSEQYRAAGEEGVPSLEQNACMEFIDWIS